MSTIKLTEKHNTMLNEISQKRKKAGELVNQKQQIVYEAIEKVHKRECK
jgi:hypothetical protein